MAANRIWFWLLFAIPTFVQAQTASEKVILNFGLFPNGAFPYGTLARDSTGNFYGTAYAGGAADQGVVFEYSAAGKYNVLYSFLGGAADGSGPYAGVTLDSAGNLYGTTQSGGAANMGVVYEISAAGEERVLHSFTGGTDGNYPYAGVAIDSQGNLYGTTYYGGASNAGVVYKINTAVQESVLYAFTGGADGGNPYAGVTLDSSGNLFGTAYNGGTGGGVVYKISPIGQETVVFAFGPSRDTGVNPLGGVILDSQGNLYGTIDEMVYKLTQTGQYTALVTQTYGKYGGTMSPGTVAMDSVGNLYWTTEATYGGAMTPAPLGALVKASATGEVSILYRFPGSSSPLLNSSTNAGPGTNTGVILDSDGNIYGVTVSGGVSGALFEVSAASMVTIPHSFTGAAGGTEPDGLTLTSSGETYGTTSNGGPNNFGTVYKMNAEGKETVLYSFKGGNDGALPSGPLAIDSAGNVYGTTVRGGTANVGTAFRVTSTGGETVLHSFSGGSDGGDPQGGLILSPSGVLYGTTITGGSGSLNGLQNGVVFAMSTSGEETVLHSFTGLSDGGSPSGGLVLDSSGNIYGTTGYGGTANGGVIYELTPGGQETVIYSFTGGSDGAYPGYGVIRTPAGNFYGTNAAGGAAGGGVVFELNSSGKLTIFHDFGELSEGELPYALVRDAAGDLYGSTLAGGATDCDGGCGLVYKIDAAGGFTTLYTFTGGADGTAGALALSPTGTLYGAGALGSHDGGSLYKIVF